MTPSDHDPELNLPFLIFFDLRPLDDLDLAELQVSRHLPKFILSIFFVFPLVGVTDGEDLTLEEVKSNEHGEELISGHEMDLTFL